MFEDIRSDSRGYPNGYPEQGDGSGVRIFEAALEASRNTLPHRSGEVVAAHDGTGGYHGTTKLRAGWRKEGEKLA